ncbi:MULTISPECIES: methionine--tRNA ligase [Prochlorococcus]|uniref:Methionine--tRNA ligase n=1 Tax=Prochlorococcus marinus (strain SARG / CCMP1375 / SS120) TaxID=167539 RepID=Q7VBX2_PROMA|nr:MULTISPECIES: methionine--tRNA ligase [Prochlorococcus]AAQ00015.1 Methionyl-tRNA synthetase [Prochlorococcus marinus subsp. marinus str. CCMP1375]KGG13810.1 Methionyl-tRNA synthetase [Prochlorococcus marinus str. LG]KGG18945.1 Methionyl-tRNA synthetase [Prochlorococcus marinus str. SS2]KGG23517.1 Methionyl-tRNA synthetase [Prochlorococcus marinus str. SS35]KGG32247.1 Methionyl-tRNA synthetase [Prochlorococcus marinus str. SS51]
MTITITTPLYYVNDKPHLGSTYTTIACDAFARYKKLNGNNVVFITGVDEHGQKIERTAKANNISPSDHCSKIASQYEMLWKKWSISNDKFIRTTSSQHKTLVEKFFHRVDQNGDIRLGRQQGWYCVGCEEYKDDPPGAKDPICSTHKMPLEWRDEENLFFCLSKYQTKIENLISQPNFVQPISRRNEIINFVSKGLKDFSISRVNISWGIPVPGFKGHTFYVWFDALLGYLSGLQTKGEVELDELNNYGWPADVHVIGKDILRFHAVYWPAMLMSAGLDLPHRVFGHGFLTREGNKMGKSLGNVLDPELLLDKYGEDPVRWYLLSDIKFGQDGDFQEKRFIDLTNNDLANTIGNLLNRTSSMSRKWFSNCVPNIHKENENNELKLLASKTISDVINYYEQLSFKEACKAILDLASSSNLYLNDNEPWKLIKQNSERELVSYHLYNVLESCRIVATLIAPVLPNLSRKILNQLGFFDSLQSWEHQLVWGVLEKGQELPEPSPIIPRLE